MEASDKPRNIMSPNKIFSLNVQHYGCDPVGLVIGRVIQLFTEHIQWYRLYGMSMRPVPETWEAFQEYWDHMCRNVLEDNKATRDVLDLSGLGTKKVRTNEQGKTRPLSFRDIARLIIIDEETVIKEDSPVLSGQFTSKTVESGVFRWMLRAQRLVPRVAPRHGSERTGFTCRWAYLAT